MPTISKPITITITPEQFVNQCSETELIELANLLSARLDREMRMQKLEMYRKLASEMNAIKQKR